MKRTEKPWGNFINLWTEGANIKIIEVKPESRLSLQSHKRRDEFWFLLSGDLECRIGDKKMKMKKGIVYSIPRGTKHRLWANKKGGKIIEVSLGKFDEEDIIRYEDDYGRTGTSSG